MATTALLLIASQAAQATFHLMKIREVYPGGSDNGSYVELQMWTAGQDLVGTHHLVSYSSGGAVSDDFALPSNVSNGANQATILVADSSYGTVFPGKPAPDASDSNLNLSPAGGAVCWIEGSPPDCVAWGNFTGPFPSHVPALVAGSPASPGGVSAGKALRRSIAPGCSTLLESGDDTDNSATDFSEQIPNPRDNASPIIETVCAGLPDTGIDTHPATRTSSTTATFTFHASPATGASFECQIDEGGFVACPASYPGLSEGEHEFEVRAVNSGGTDPTPAVFAWTVDLTPPVATVDEPKPPNPSPGSGLTFKYHSNETGSAFQCSLVESGLPDSFKSCAASGVTFPKITKSGNYVFRVKAIDQAANTGTAASYEFAIDTSLADTDPPETTIESKPTDPTESTSVSFTYISDEADSTFQCSLDGAAFAACTPTGITYNGLAVGPHTFEVAAIDSSLNKDPTPAGYSFTVVAPPSSGGGGGGSGPAPTPEPTPKVAPDTKVTTKPPAKTQDRTPTLKFKATIGGATYQCKLDGGAYKACRSPYTTKSLSFGKHTVKVRALAGGLTDATPASVTFKVVKPR